MVGRVKEPGLLVLTPNCHLHQLGIHLHQDFLSNKAIKLCIIKQDILFFVLFCDVEQKAS